MPLFQTIFDEIVPRNIEESSMKRSQLSTKVWIVLGAFVAALACLPVFIVGNPTPIGPLPIYVLIIFIVTGMGAVLVLPILFAIQFLVLHKRQNFNKIQASLLMVLWALTPLYFWSSWDSGLRWMGVLHTITVFAIHVLGLAVLSSLAWIGLKKNSASLNNTLNILSFFFLFWGAFPVLGEMP